MKAKWEGKKANFVKAYSRSGQGHLTCMYVLILLTHAFGLNYPFQAHTQDFWKEGDKISHEHIFYFNYGQKSYYNKLRKK